MAELPPITHVAVTVTDLNASAAWYERLFDMQPALDEDGGGFYHKVYALGGGTLFGLHAHPDGAEGRFDVLRPGLDHVAFGCSSRAELEQWQSKLDDLGLEHGGIIDAHYGSGLSFKDPDGTALEFFAPPG
ncbi:MAG: VOC family protein [Geodermatophilaceae bacterium]